jgi:putative ABC transport system permease protein
MLKRFAKKIWRDMWGQKARSLLVILSVGVGVLAISVLIRTRVVVSREMAANYAAANPASAVIVTDPFDDGLVQTIRRMGNVAEVSGRSSLNVRLRQGEDEWTTLRLMAIPDFDDMSLNIVRHERGAWPPARRELLVERSSLLFAAIEEGDALLVQTPDGRQRTLTVSGVAFDAAQIPSLMTGQVYGYVTFETFEWLGQSRYYNELHFTVAEGATDRAHIQRVTEQVVNKVEKSGREVYATTIPEPGRHWFDPFFQPIAYILEAIGLLTLFLSGFLVVTTITALLMQQVRQVGVMKAVGARPWQIALLYLMLVFLFGVFALVVAVPLSAAGSRLAVDGLAGFANLEISSYDSPAQVVVLELALALLVPVLAALYPILTGTRITIREAINSYGVGAAFGGTLLHRLLENVRGLPRPLLMSLRNTFRNGSRLALTLTTLTLGGSIFMSVMVVNASLATTFNSLFEYWQYDVQVTFSRPYRLEELERQAHRVSGVAGVEGWGMSAARRLRDDHTESEHFLLYAPPADTAVIQPIVLQGRWLLPDDEQALVINTDMLKEEPDIRLGDEILLKMGGRDTSWQVVGVIQGTLTGPVAYANYPAFARTVREPGQGSILQLVTTQHDAAFQAQVAQLLEAQFKQSQLRVDTMLTTAEEQARTLVQINIIVIFLLLVATLLALVGSIGLTGTMGINVLERSREIGVMRAVGASNRAIFQVIIAEGVIIGLMSWFLGMVISLPLGRVLSDTFGNILTRSPLIYTFSLNGIIAWLLIATLLSALASFLPARAATRLTVREVLDYE